jgi:hypothetical protein
MKNHLFTTIAGVLLAASMVQAQVGTSTATTTLGVGVTAEAALNINTSNTSLTSTGNNFANYTGTTNFTYYIRTSPSSGSGTVTLKVTGDFSPAGGPSVATPPTAGDKLTYSCTVSTPGSSGGVTNCPASTVASFTTSTLVGTFGADARSIITGNSGSVNWALTNDPAYKANTYSATITFTISAS